MNLKKLFLTMFIALSSVMSMMAYTVMVYPDHGTIDASVDGPFTNFTVTPEEGYEFWYWDVDGVTVVDQTANPLSIRTGKLTEAVELIAMVKPKPVEQVNLTVMSTANKYGTVTGSGTYNVGESVTITATPKEGCMFTGWDDDNEELERTITVSSSKTVYIANFAEIAKYTIDANSNNPLAGTVTGTGVYLSGTDVSLTATPNAGYYFAYWSDGSFSADRTVQATSNKTYTATFLELLTIDVMPEDTEMGSTTGSATGKKPGDEVTIEAIAKSGYRFVGWSKGTDEEKMTNPRVITIGTKDETYIASFREIRWNLSFDVNDNEMGLVIGTEGDFRDGQKVTISASANAGYEFVGWSDGVATATRTVTMDADKTLTANFEPIVKTVRNLSSSNIGSICLPRAVAEGDFTGAKFYKIAYKTVDANGDPTNLYFDEVTELEAGMPYIFQPEDGATKITVRYTGEAAAAQNYKGLYGSLEGTAVAEGCYVVSNNKFQKCGKGCKIGEQRAYIKMEEVPAEASADAPGRICFSFNEANVATDLETLLNEKVQKVMIDGQVYIQREGQLYNVNGQLVK